MTNENGPAAILCRLQPNENSAWRPPRYGPCSSAWLDVADMCQQQIPLGGEDGIPSYMAGPHDDVEHIMATLNRTCGKWNFHLTIPTSPMPRDFFD